MERGEKTEKKHYQGRFSLLVKKRQSEIIKILALEFKKFHVSVTSKANRDNEFYVMKEDTRIEGPWTDRNDVYIPRDVLEVKELYPWQESLRKELSFYHARRIDVVYDKKGCQGKSLFTRYMQCYDNAALLPYCLEHKTLMEYAYANRTKKIFFIDIARALDQKKMSSFYAGLEDLKTGNIFDGRFKFKQALIDPPRVCVFTNTLPDLRYLTSDRWVFWQIRDKKLVKYLPEVEDAESHTTSDDVWEDEFDADSFSSDSYSDIDIPPSLMKKGVTKLNYHERFREPKKVILDTDLDSSID